MDGYEWDPAKAAANLKKHKVDFADAALSLEDPNALTVADPDASDEERFICLAADPEGRLLVTVYAHRGDSIRIISSRSVSRGERRRYEEQ
jgi:uncharacterized DUF497 family protein